LVGSSLKNKRKLDEIAASLDILELILSRYYYFKQNQQQFDYSAFFSLLSNHIKQNSTKSRLQVNSPSYWKGAYATTQWIIEKWEKREELEERKELNSSEDSVFFRYLREKHDALLIHIPPSLRPKHLYGIFYFIFQDLFSAKLRKMELERCPPPSSSLRESISILQEGED
jgi:hypothetical protein